MNRTNGPFPVTMETDVGICAVKRWFKNKPGAGTRAAFRPLYLAQARDLIEAFPSDDRPPLLRFH
jgi:hypothetical protein